MAVPVPFTAPFTNRELELTGFTRAHLRTWLRAGVVVQLARGVYVRQDCLPRHSDLQLANFGGSRATSLAYSAEIQGIWLPPKLTPHDRSPQRTDRVPEQHLRRVRGAVITDIPWTAVRLAQSQEVAAAMVPLDSARRHGSGISELLEVCSPPPRVSHQTQLQRLIELSSNLSESPLEAFARGRFMEMRLPSPTQQLQIQVRNRVFRADFAWPEWRLLVEADGEAKYEDADEARRERYRQHLLHDVGWSVERFGWRDVLEPASGFLKVLQRRLDS